MDQEYEKYKNDKLIEYLKFISTLHLGVIGVVVTFKDKFLSGHEVELAFWITVIFLFASFVATIYGYITLINSYFEQPKHHLAIATFARKWPGYVLVASITSFLIQIFLLWLN